MSSLATLPRGPTLVVQGSQGIGKGFLTKLTMKFNDNEKETRNSILITVSMSSSSFYHLHGYPDSILLITPCSSCPPRASIDTPFTAESLPSFQQNHRTRQHSELPLASDIAPRLRTEAVLMTCETTMAASASGFDDRRGFHSGDTSKTSRAVPACQVQGRACPSTRNRPI
jgi:hypothetical protein